MERSSKRGKIPQQDWPSIIARYEAGETLASIARTYDCSPPAISYILSRSRARATAAAAISVAAPAAEESDAAPSRGGDSAGEAGPRPAPAVPAKTAPTPGEGNGAVPSQGQATANPNPSRPPVAPGGASNGAHNGAERRTLHLSHGHANGPERNGEPFSGYGRGARPTGAPQSAFPHPASQPPLPVYASGNGAPPRPQTGQSPPPLPGLTATDHRERSPGITPIDRRERGSGFAATERREPPVARGARPVHPGMETQPRDGISPDVVSDPQQPKDGGAIDQALRERVHADIAAFVAAFDAALAEDSPASRAGLREATDRLLRAGARTRIELERLEARLPLPARDRPAAAMPAWRQR